MNTLDLESLERKAWRSFHQDGFFDIMLGIVMIAMGAIAYIEETGLPLAWGTAIFVAIEMIGILVMMLGKRYVTTPRLGRAKFGAGRKRRKVGAIGLLTLSALLGLVLFLIPVTNAAAGTLKPALFPLIWLVNCTIVFGGLAYFLDFNRLYLIGGLYALAIPVDFVIKQQFHLRIAYVVFSTVGLIALVMGLVVLARFLRDYPVVSQEDGDVSA